LVDGSLVAVDRVHHPLEHGIKELARFLGISVGEQLHRPLKVGEEYGDLFALALEGALRREDPLNEVLRRIRLWRGEPRCRRQRRGSCGQCCAAAIAELAPSLDLRTTAWASRRECRAALPAETGTVAVLCLAPGTLHAVASEHSGWRRSER